MTSFFKLDLLFYFMFITFATITPEGSKLSPCGYRLCIEKCLHLSGCHLIEFSRLSLTCQYLESHSQISSSIYLNLSTWEKPYTPMPCKRSSRFILTRHSGVKCVPPVRKPLYDEEVRLKKRPSSGKKSKIRFEKKRQIQPQITGFIAAVRRDVIQLQLFYLNTRLPTVQSKRYRGRILDMKTWSNHIYWCQEKPTKCVKMIFHPQTKRFQQLNETTLAALTIAVDEFYGVVFLGGYQTTIFQTYVNFKLKAVVPLKKRAHNLQACHKIRRLYVGYGTGIVGVHTYSGQLITEINLKYTVLAMDVDAGGVLYATDSAGHLCVIKYPNPGVRKSDLPKNANPNVFADENKMLMIIDMKILLMDDHSYTEKYLSVEPPVDRSDKVQYAAFYGEHKYPRTSRGRGSVTGSSKRPTVSSKVKDCSLGNESIVLASTSYPTNKEFTQLTKVDLKTGKTSVMEFLQARLVDIDIDNSMCYWCLAAPNGIHQHKMGSHLNIEPLLKERCHAIAGDTTQNLIFYATSDHLTRYSIDRSSKKLMNIFIKNTVMKELQVFLDRRERVVYVCLGNGKSIFWSKYDLQKRHKFSSYQRSKIFTISNDGKFYYTNARTDILQLGKITVASWKRQQFLKKNLKLHQGIKRIILVGNKIVVELKRSVRVFCKETLKEVHIKTPWIHLKSRSHHMVGIN